MSVCSTIKTQEENLLCHTYGRYPVCASRAKGSHIWDVNGKEYLDLLSGIGVTSIGHCNDEIAAVISNQARKLIHVSNLFYQKEQLELAQLLLETNHLDKVFFCNSGAEANEAAIKIARRYQQVVQKRDAYEIITLQNAFHGRTLAALAATGREALLEGFDPISPGFVQVPWDDIDSLETAITHKTAAILMEIIQGEAGVYPASETYAKKVEELCLKHNILFMIDEVQTGLCRTGKWWAFQHYDLKPDVITSAKALANGLPMGAMMCTNEVSKAFTTGAHATTFGGGALVSAVGAKVIEIMQRDNLAERAERLGKATIDGLRDISSPHIKEVRGWGLMIGIEMNLPDDQVKKLWEELLGDGFILNIAHGNTLRLLPPITTAESDLLIFIETFKMRLSSATYQVIPM